jgi:hypothetical protein
MTFWAACGLAAQTPQERAELKQVIESVDTEIADAKATDAKYSGGLVKALIESRLATLQQTRAMLEQRANAGLFSIGVKYRVDGKPFTPPADTAAQLAAVESELASLRTNIKAQEAEVARYSGGLVLAMAMSTLATSRQTEAMVEQKRLALKFGLPQFIGFATAQPTSTSAVGSSRAPAPAAPKLDDVYEIVSIDAKVTETNDTWWRYAWKLTLRNKTSERQAFRATIEFQDKDGFVIDSTQSDSSVIEPNSEGTGTGFALVRVPGAQNVSRTLAKVSLVGR